MPELAGQEQSLDSGQSGNAAPALCYWGWVGTRLDRQTAAGARIPPRQAPNQRELARLVIAPNLTLAVVAADEYHHDLPAPGPIGGLRWASEPRL